MSPSTAHARVYIATTSRTQPSSRLLRWLNQGSAADLDRYREIRRRLVWYFDRRTCASVEDLADETFGLIERHLAFQDPPRCPPARYCYLVARLVADRAPKRPRARSRDDAPTTAVHLVFSRVRQTDDEPAEPVDVRLGRLNDCERELLVEFYRNGSSPDARAAMAERMGLSLRALTALAHRLRRALCAAPATRHDPHDLRDPRDLRDHSRP